MAVEDLILTVEKELTAELQAAWGPLAARVLAEVWDAVDAGDFTRAKEVANQLTTADMADEAEELVKAKLLEAALAGASGHKGDLSLIEGDHDKWIDNATDQVTISIAHNVRRQAFDKLVQLIADAEALVAAGETFATKARFLDTFQSFTEDGDQALQTISQLHTSRLGVWGFVAEAESRGIEQYAVRAVDNDRTCDYCSMVDGTVFDVEDAKNSVEQALSTKNPDDLRELAPWPDRSKDAIAELRGKTSDELADLGYHVPPFHPGCLCVCEAIEGENDDSEDAEPVKKANPYHDAQGRFTTADGASSVSVGPKFEKTKHRLAEAYIKANAPAEYKGWEYDPKYPAQLINPETGEIKFVQEAMHEKAVQESKEELLAAYQQQGGRTYRGAGRDESLAELDKDLRARTSAEFKALPEADRAAIFAYTSESTKLNAYVSGSYDPSLDKSGFGTQALEARVGPLDEALAKTRIPVDVVSYRGMDARSLGLGPGDAVGKGLVGREFVDPAYGSTSVDPEVGKSYAKDGRVLLRIKNRAGSTGAYLGNDITRTRYSWENELLLPRNTRYRITDVKNVGAYSHVLEVERI